jgi:hypothetical protein
MAFHLQPVDRVHPPVAWWPSGPISSPRTNAAAAARADGWYAPAFYQAPPPVLGFTQALPSAPSPWDPHSLANAFSTVSLTPPTASADWAIDSGASSHIASKPGIVTPSPSYSFPSSIVVGNGAILPVVGTGYSTILGPFRLNNVLIAPDIIHNLLSIHKFTTDNSVSVEFDPLG